MGGGLSPGPACPTCCLPLEMRLPCWWLGTKGNMRLEGHYKHLYFVTIFNWGFLLLPSFRWGGVGSGGVCVYVYIHTDTCVLRYMENRSDSGGLPESLSTLFLRQIPLCCSSLIQEDLACQQVTEWPVRLSSTGVPGICCCVCPSCSWVPEAKLKSFVLEWQAFHQLSCLLTLV